VPVLGSSRRGSTCFARVPAPAFEGMTMRRDTLRTLAACVCAALLGVSGARAVDGVIEINDASIVAAGGYPAVIGTSGSYVLTGNLAALGGTDAIDVFAPDVTLDLNGFQILGVGVGTGISGVSTGLTVRNGSVTGFTTGIAAGAASKVFQVKTTGNAGTGISGSACLVVESTVDGNGVGIAAQGCKVENNVIRGNTAAGILGMNNVIVHNHVEGNGGGGILTVGGGGTIQENVINMNATFGISDGILGPPPPTPQPPPGPLPERVDIRGNKIHGNGGLAGGPGISFLFPVLISDNTVSGNTGSGVVCGYGCTLRGNLIDSNNTLALPASGGASVGDGGNVTDNSISFNSGFGLSISVFSGYSQNTLNCNGPGFVPVCFVGPDVIPVGGPGHPTSGFMNLCSGVPGPAILCP
jgi:hypothetical protein